MQLSDILIELSKAFKARDVLHLKQVAEFASSKAFSEKEDLMTLIAVVAYSLAKIVEKGNFINSRDWKKFEKAILSRLMSGMSEKAFLKTLEDISDFSDKHGRFVKNVVDKARIKVATQAYAHGASLGVASSFAGVDKRDLASYIALTHLNEKYQTISLTQRLQSVQKALSDEMK